MEMLEDFERKKAELTKDADELRAKRDGLKSDASEWSKKRDGLNAKVKEMLEAAQKHKERREKYNVAVSKNKAKRGENEKKVGEFYAKIEELRRKNNLSVGISLNKLKEEIEKLEFAQQTQVLSSDKEKKIVGRISMLRRELKRKEEELERHAELKKLLERASHFKEQTTKYRERSAKLARLAQECHNRMLSTYEEVDKIRAEADDAHKNFVEAQEKADEVHKKLVKTLKDVRDFDKVILTLKRKDTKVAMDSAKSDAEKIFEQFKQGVKLNTEDLLRLQRSEFL
jgi:uncharacterized coiled-coil DUF342 family protein